MKETSVRFKELDSFLARTGGLAGAAYGAARDIFENRNPLPYDDERELRTYLLETESLWTESVLSAMVDADIKFKSKQMRYVLQELIDKGSNEGIRIGARTALGHCFDELEMLRLDVLHEIRGVMSVLGSRIRLNEKKFDSEEDRWVKTTDSMRSSIDMLKRLEILVKND